MTAAAKSRIQAGAAVAVVALIVTLLSTAGGWVWWGSGVTHDLREQEKADARIKEIARGADDKATEARQDIAVISSDIKRMEKNILDKIDSFHK